MRRARDGDAPWGAVIPIVIPPPPIVIPTKVGTHGCATGNDAHITGDTVTVGPGVRRDDD